MVPVILGIDQSNGTASLQILERSQVNSCYLSNFCPLHLKSSTYLIQVNVVTGRVFFLANMSITAVTFVVNLWAGLCILGKEKTRLHLLIVCDCVLNIVSCIHTSFVESPWSILDSSILCLLNSFFLTLLVAWNRLVPLTIAAFRYIMVCHAVFVQNHGGEKQVGLRSRNIRQLVQKVSSSEWKGKLIDCFRRRCGKCWCRRSPWSASPSPSS